MRVAIPYVVRLRDAEVVLPARYMVTPEFGVTVTFALDVVLEISMMVVPFANATFAVVGIYRMVLVACV
jgi:hypothetical protein